MTEKKRKANNPTGKGGFQERPWDVHTGGVTKEQWAKVQENRNKAHDLESRMLDALKAEFDENERAIVDHIRGDVLKLIHTAMERHDGKPRQATDITSSDGSMKPTTIQLVAPDDDDSGN